MSRKLASFIDGFVQYTEGKGSPAIYRKWAAIFLVGSILERKAWLRTVKGKLYPNQYILLVGAAGIGKSLMTNLVTDLLSAVRTPERPFHIAPLSTTKASLVDALNEAERRIVRPMEIPAVHSFNSLTVAVDEFGVFLPSWEVDFMSFLTHIWDNKSYSETRRTSKLCVDIASVQLNLFSATTPTHLSNLLPEGAWEQGFMARVLPIFSSEEIYVDLFAEFAFDDQLHSNLVHDLTELYGMWGEFRFTDEAKETISEWARSGGLPAPDHPKLLTYKTRRPAHLLKLCLIASAASSTEYLITIDHVAEALDWLVEAEGLMPDIFKSMKAGGDGRAIEECWHFARQIYMKEKKPVLEHRLHHFLLERVPAHNVPRILDVMERARLLEKKFTDGGLGFVPRASQVA